MPSSTGRTREASFWPLQVAGWLAFGVTMAASRVGRYPWSYMIASKGVMTALGFVLTSFILRPLYRRVLRAEPALPVLIALMAVCSYITAAVWTAAHSLVDIHIERAILSPTAHISSVWQVFGGTLYDAFTIFSWSVLYVGIKHQQALYQERERSLRAEALAHEARLEALRWQLNPHFLFNALNAISTLVVDGRQADAAKMIARLGDLLRTTLERGDGSDVALAEELELVRRYLDIEQVRLGDRLALRVDVEPDVWKARVPSLLLQPLVENAVRHAIAVREEGGRIVISARRVRGVLEIAVEDDGPGLGGSALGARRSAGVGLANTQERLTYKYGEAHRFELRRGALGGMRVEIDVPFREDG